MQSTLCPCAQMILDCSQQASQMSITLLQRLSVCPLLLANKDPFLIQTWLTRILLVGLSKSELFQQAQDAAQFVFADDVVKKSLKEVFKHAEKRLLMQDELAAPN